ncbi:MAG: MerR family transcriptional regulator [Cephaloticoccus sp.]|nr:MerR family transcriptional regulator [Cephaloticoccus sp.]MCF7759232.1 MerR family transcriptional regulator [Cephaloticoccus sp.]
MNEDTFYTITPEEDISYHAIEEVVKLTGFSRHTIAVFCRQGFVMPVDGEPAAEVEWTFDNDAVRVLRHLAQLHHQHGLDLDGLRLIGPLLAELEILRTEVRFLRRR